MFSVTKPCGRCGELVDFQFAAVFEHTQRTPEEVRKLRELSDNASAALLMGIQNGYDDAKALGAALCYCPRCHGPAMIVFECRRVTLEAIRKTVSTGTGRLLGGSSQIAVLEVHPKPAEPETDPHWPEEIVREFKDAQSMLAQHMSPSIILSTCRTVLEVATKKLNASSNDKLYKRIETLRANGVITQPISDWAHAIRLDGNDATHDAVGDEASAREYVEFLRMFLNMAFSLPKRIKAKQKNAQH